MITKEVLLAMHRGDPVMFRMGPEFPWERWFPTTEKDLPFKMASYEWRLPMQWEDVVVQLAERRKVRRASWMAGCYLIARREEPVGERPIWMCVGVEKDGNWKPNLEDFLSTDWEVVE
jgi:hypothetical protein